MLISNTLKYFARALKQRTTLQQKLQKAALVPDIELVKSHQPSERLPVEQIDQAGLSRIRLDQQYLPQTYLKRVQQVFGKYNQGQLREIAGKFSQLMKLRYWQQKVDYSKVKPFARLKQPLKQKVQKIYLVGSQKAENPDVREQQLREEEQPVGVTVEYNQNAVMSYLLNRVPRTFAVAVRIFIEIKYKYPQFKPTTMIDFGSGLSSGSYAFADVFQQFKGIYNVEPNQHMTKLSKFLTQDIDILHYRALGQLSRLIKDADVVYSGYVLNEIESDKIQIYVQALWTKVKPGGFLVLVEYGNPFGSRITHDVRKWATQKGIQVVMPCPHQLQCPMAKTKRWCHFDQPAGMYSKTIFGKLPTEHSVQLQKFAYLVLHKQGGGQVLTSSLSQQTNHWDRIVFPTIKRGKHIIMDMCTTEGKLQRRVSAKSHGQEYKEARKLKWGDLWRFGNRVPNKYRKQHKRGRRLW